MSYTNSCPGCGNPLPSSAPEGLCPACLLGQGMQTETEPVPESPPFSPPAPADLAALFPQLEILELIGKGGMGAVYKARQPDLDRLVALKILPPQKTQDPRFAERFSREARTMARLNHPNIVAVHDFGAVEGLHYFVMEYVDGLNLRQLERSGRLSPREALQIITQICEALQFAHDQGVVHRDIKPENVLVDRTGRVRITDFGIAKILGREPQGPTLTRVGQVVGTPHYMAPEQIEHPREVDHRADIYSLGVVFYELLTGELPLGKFSPPSQKVQVDVRLDEVVLHALEKEPQRRYQHASEVKTDVESIGDVAGPARPAAPARSCRIPGTSLSLVEMRDGQRRVNWTHAALAWLLLLVVGEVGLGVAAAIAKELLPFSLNPGFFPTAGVAMGFLLALFLSFAVRSALLCPPQLERPPTARVGHGEERVPAAMAAPHARRLLRWPATGVSAIGLCTLVICGLFLGAGQWPEDWRGLLAIGSVSLIGYQILLGAWRMRQLKSYRLAVLAAVVSLIFALPGLPLAVFPIWALVILFRPDVRAAFGPDAQGRFLPHGGVRRFVIVTGSGLALGLILVYAVKQWDRHDKAEEHRAVASRAGSTRLLAVAWEEGAADPLVSEWPPLRHPETGEELPQLARGFASAGDAEWRIPPDPDWAGMPVVCLTHRLMDEDSLHFAQLTVPHSVEFVAGGFARSHNLNGRFQFLDGGQAAAGSQGLRCFVVALGGMRAEELAKLKTAGWRPRLEVALGLGEWTDAGTARIQPSAASTVKPPGQDGLLRLWRAAEPSGSSPPVRLRVSSTLRPELQYRVRAQLVDGRLLRPSRTTVELDPSQTIVTTLEYEADPRELLGFQVRTRVAAFVDLGRPDFSFAEPPVPAPHSDETRGDP